MEQSFLLGGDLLINRMGFGAMRITGKGIWGAPGDQAQAIEVLRSLPELGVDFIDTADSYGPNVSEELIAEALHPYRNGLVIATKGGFMRTGPNEWHVKSDPDHLKRALEGSLKRLKVEMIDLYQLHRIDPNVPFEVSLKFLREARDQGLIRHIGLSEVSVDEIKKAQEYVDVATVQNKYSIVFRKWEPELEYCAQNNIGFIPWNPINAGNILFVELLKELAEKYGATMQQVALSWLYHHAPNIILIPGTSKVAHLRENVASVNVKLSAEDMKRMANFSV